MLKCIVVYTSMTGNTEEIAQMIGEEIRKAEIEVVVKDSIFVNPEELLEYDGVIIGAYTWNHGELPDEFHDFFEEMEHLDLKGKIAAAFGSGDRSYPLFCQAVEILSNKLKELGADVVGDGLKIEGAPDEKGLGQCRDFGRKIIESLVCKCL